MKYQFNLKVTEKDYIDFNTFWMFRAPYGKKQILTYRIVIAAILAVFALVSLFGGGFSKEAFIGIIPTILILVVFQLIFKPMFSATLKGQIKKMKKAGKPGYSESAVMEFYDDNFVETTPENRTEVKYSAIEKVSVVDDTVIYIHVNNVMAYILTFTSFESINQREEFLDFLKEKGATVDIYKK